MVKFAEYGILQPSMPQSFIPIKYFLPELAFQICLEPTILQKVVIKGINLVEFPILKNSPIAASFSWGTEQMSDIWAENNLRARGVINKQVIVKAKKEALEKQRHFMEQAGMATFPYVARIVPGIHNVLQTEEITQKDLSRHLASGATDAMKYGANFLITKIKGLTLHINLADCVSWVFWAKDAWGETVLGVLHGGRYEINEGLPKRAIAYMKALRCDISTMKLAGCPGVSKKNYYIQEKDRKRILKGKDAAWGNRLRAGKAIEDGKIVNVVYLDLLGRTIDQFLSIGIRADQIEAYGVDTYKAAEQGETFSHRFWLRTNKKGNPKFPLDNGRMILAAMIKKP